MSVNGNVLTRSFQWHLLVSRGQVKIQKLEATSEAGHQVLRTRQGILVNIQDLIHSKLVVATESNGAITSGQLPTHYVPLCPEPQYPLACLNPSQRHLS